LCGENRLLSEPVAWTPDSNGPETSSTIEIGDEEMKRLLAAIATAAFAAATSAGDDVYNSHGNFAAGVVIRSDISFDPAQVTAVRPGVGDSGNIYGALGNQDSDLFQWRPENTAASPGGKAPDIYKEFGGSPDVQY
jgi:hypothetical protein